MAARHLRKSGALFVSLLSALLADADTVKLHGKPPFEHVTILDYRTGRLVFRGVSREILRKPLDEIEWFTLDDHPALSAAERAAAAGRWATALAGYERGLAAAADAWLRSLVELRLLEAAQRAGRFDLAVRLYVELLESKPMLVRPHAPTRPGPVGSPVNGLARRLLEQAAEDASPAARAAARSLLLELMVYEDVSPLPPWARDDHDPEADQPVSRPVQGILPPASPPAARVADPPPVIRAPSLLWRMSGEALADGEARHAETWLTRGLPFVAPELADAWVLRLGRCRLERGQYAAAAEQLLGLAEATSDGALAATALYYVGVAHHKLGRADIARQLYRELLTREDTPAEIAQQARDALQRLGP